MNLHKCIQRVCIMNSNEYHPIDKMKYCLRIWQEEALFTVALFARKPILMDSFMFLKTGRITFFTDCNVWKFFFTSLNVFSFHGLSLCHRFFEAKPCCPRNFFFADFFISTLWTIFSKYVHCK